MDDKRQQIDLISGVASSRGSNGFTLYLPRGCLTVYTPRHTYDHPLCAERRLSQYKHNLSRPPAVVTAKQLRKTVPWISACSSRSERRVFTASSPSDANPTYAYRYNTYIYIPGIFQVYNRVGNVGVGGNKTLLVYLEKKKQPTQPLLNRMTVSLVYGL